CAAPRSPWNPRTRGATADWTTPACPGAATARSGPRCPCSRPRRPGRPRPPGTRSCPGRPPSRPRPTRRPCPATARAWSPAPPPPPAGRTDNRNSRTPRRIPDRAPRRVPDRTARQPDRTTAPPPARVAPRRATPPGARPGTRPRPRTARARTGTGTGTTTTGTGPAPGTRRLRVGGGERVRRGRWTTRRATVFTAGSAVLLAGCASMPDNGDLRGVESTPRRDAQVRVFAMPPSDNATPTQIVQGFLEALTSDDPQYKTARMYLTPRAAENWQPERSTTVLADGPDAAARAPVQDDDEHVAFTLTGREVATVDAQQAF